MPTTLRLSDRYRDAIYFALVLQAPLALLMTLTLDGGRLAKIGGFAMVAFWVGVAMILLRRPLTPARGDVSYIRFGYLATLVVAIAYAGWLHGVS